MNGELLTFIGVLLAATVIDVLVAVVRNSEPVLIDSMDLIPLVFIAMVFAVVYYGLKQRIGSVTLS